MSKKLLYLGTVIISGASMLTFPHFADARAPDIHGVVRVKETQAPISGVWVRWQDKMGTSIPYEAPEQRFAKTDANGEFFFKSWQDMSSADFQKEYDTMIDTNLDGTAETRLTSTVNAYHFGCSENPHVFTLIFPANWTGSGTWVSARLDNMSNLPRETTIPPLEVSSGTPTTPTPVSPTTTAICQCNGVTLGNEPKPGQSLMVVGRAKVPLTSVATSQVDHMVYQLLKNDAVIADSSAIPLPSAPRLIPEVSERGEEYQTSWAVPIPTAKPDEIGTQVHYRVQTETNCTTKVAPTVPAPVSTSNVPVQNGFLSRALSWLGLPQRTPTPPPQPQNSSPRGLTYTSPDGTEISIPQDSQTLQLGTFRPVTTILERCSSAEFDIQY